MPLNGCITTEPAWCFLPAVHCSLFSLFLFFLVSHREENPSLEKEGGSSACFFMGNSVPNLFFCASEQLICLLEALSGLCVDCGGVVFHEVSFTPDPQAAKSETRAERGEFRV